MFFHPWKKMTFLFPFFEYIIPSYLRQPPEVLWVCGRIFSAHTHWACTNADKTCTFAGKVRDLATWFCATIFRINRWLAPMVEMVKTNRNFFRRWGAGVHVRVTNVRVPINEEVANAKYWYSKFLRRRYLQPILAVVWRVFFWHHVDKAFH